MRRCEHGVYIPSDSENDWSIYCTGCSAIVKRPTPLIKETEADERHRLYCPLCLSVDFYYEAEDKFNCANCGYDETTIL